MMSQETKKEISDLTKILIKLDNTGRAIMLSNASVLLTRQEYEEKVKKQLQIVKK